MTNEMNVVNDSVDLKKERLVTDLKIVTSDTNDLLNELTNSTAEEFLAARARIEAKLAVAISALRLARVESTGKVDQVVNASRDYVKENPWKIVGIAAAGLAATYLLSRRYSTRGGDALLATAAHKREGY